MSKQPEALTLASAMTTASIVIGGLPELSGYNGAVLLIDDTERDRIVKDTEDAAAELRRLHSLNAELVDVAIELVASAWFQDSHAASFDGTVIFGPGYDYSDINGPFREEFLAKYDCIVWPSRGGKWSAYCTYDGSMWFERFDSADAAKEQCMNLLDRVLPDHPAMKARAVIAKAEAQQ